MTSVISPVIGESPEEKQGPDLPRPLRKLPPAPDPAEIRALRAAAKKHLGMSDEAAGSMSSIWVSPRDVLSQVETPRKMRIPGGNLLYVEGEAWTVRLMPDPSNPRNAAEYQYPAAGATEDADDLRVADNLRSERAEMVRTARSPKDLEKALKKAMSRTRKANDPYPPIAEQGIMDAPFGVMEVIEFEDTAASVAVPCVREGSSRVSHAHASLGIEPSDTINKFVNSATAIKRMIAELNALVASPAKDLDKDDRAKIRCATAPFLLIVGFEADHAGTVDLGEAIKAKVAQEHLNTKMDWSEPAQNSAMADDCLRAVLNARVLAAEEYQWLLGRMDWADAVSRGIATNHDDRFARLIYLFATTEAHIHDAVRRPIAFVLRKDTTKKTAVRRTKKIPLAAELVAREVRGQSAFPPAAVERVVKVLVSGAQITASGTGMKASSYSTLDALVEEAENEADSGAIGAAGLELAMRALYYLALHDAIRLPRNDLGLHSDRRTVGDVLDTMLRLPQGINQLRMIIEDGRSGMRPLLRDENGDEVLSGDGEPVPLSNSDLRYKLFPKRDPAAAASDADDSDPFEAAQLRFEAAVQALEEARAGLVAVSDEDEAPVVDQVGVSPTRALKWRTALGSIRDDVDSWFEKGLQLNRSA